MLSENAILMIEDNPDDILLTELALRNAGIKNKLIVIRSGESALDFLFFRNEYADRSVSDEPVLIILDLGLPGIPGTKVLEQIRANARTSLIPVIVLTASNGHEDMLKSLRLGVQGYLRKPLELGDLLDRAILNGFQIMLIAP